MTNLIRQTYVLMIEAQYFSLYFELLFTVEINVAKPDEMNRFDCCRLLSDYNMENDILNECTQTNKLRKFSYIAECF